MKKTYSTPALRRYGSIAECTFATPNNGGTRSDPLSDGTFACNSTAGSDGNGNKNFDVLQCDTFGEYSHS